MRIISLLRDFSISLTDFLLKGQQLIHPSVIRSKVFQRKHNNVARASSGGTFLSPGCGEAQHLGMNWLGCAFIGCCVLLACSLVMSSGCQGLIRKLGREHFWTETKEEEGKDRRRKEKNARQERVSDQTCEQVMFPKVNSIVPGAASYH